MWRYFSKINIDTLVDIARWKKEQQQHHHHHHQNGKDDTANTTTFADLRKRFGQHRKSIKNRMKKLYNRSNSCEMHDLHHDAGKQMSLNGNGIDIKNHAHHRGSSSSGGSRDTSGTSTSANSMDKMPSCNGSGTTNKTDGLSAYFNKRTDRHLFSSMLKKSRTSLTFDDMARKKIISLAAIGGRTIAKNKPTEHLSVRLKLNLIVQMYTFEMEMCFLFYIVCFSIYRKMGAIANSMIEINKRWRST